MAAKSIVVLATLDTKGPEAQYLREQIEGHGHKAVVVDTGVVGTPSAKADVTREQVAQAAGTTLAELLNDPSRETAAPFMADRATQHRDRPLRGG